MLPNLETIEFSEHSESFVGEPIGTLNLKNLKKIILVDYIKYYSDNAILINFFSKILPENILAAFEVEDNGNFGKILSKQKNIKELMIRANAPVFHESLNELQLEKLTLKLLASSFPKERRLKKRQKFVKAILNSQPNLTYLEIVKGSHTDGDDEVIDNEIFRQIPTLSKLETLVINADGVTNLEGLQNLRNLKNLIFRSMKRDMTPFSNNFASLKLESIKKIFFQFLYINFNEENYQSMAVNLPNLKDLRYSSWKLN